MGDEYGEYKEEILCEHLGRYSSKDCSHVNIRPFEGMTCVTGDQDSIEMACDNKGDVDGKGNPKGDTCE
jgi:hypothetical protein